MRITGVGTDLVEVVRISGLLERYGERFMRKIFTEKEIRYCSARPDPAVHFSGRFAAKEAVAKAAYQSGWLEVIPWRNIEITNDTHGRPSVNITPQVFSVCHLSIAHDGAYALAFAVGETDHV
ncbi:MAG: holo-ACP synthase [Lentisphaeria bacterium]|nr:holo-ACP synthase [Candidatus Neomarinimicrobiota bacterium]MCF7842251.1 holo-ACP synthase [Lentisphaeria bacterium]